MLCPVDVPKAQDPTGRGLGAAKWKIKNSMSGRDIKQLAVGIEIIFSWVIFNFEIPAAEY
jgi:hypothetical protein